MKLIRMIQIPSYQIIVANKRVKRISATIHSKNISQEKFKFFVIAS